MTTPAREYRMANPDKRTSYIAKLVSAARSIITYQVALPLGCTRMSKILYWLKPFEKLDFPVFDEYSEATQALPTGSERLQWSREALRDKDLLLESINQEFRDRVFEACYDILDKFDTPQPQPPTVI